MQEINVSSHQCFKVKHHFFMFVVVKAHGTMYKHKYNIEKLLNTYEVVQRPAS